MTCWFVPQYKKNSLHSSIEITNIQINFQIQIKLWKIKRMFATTRFTATSLNKGYTMQPLCGFHMINYLHSPCGSPGSPAIANSLYRERTQNAVLLWTDCMEIMHSSSEFLFLYVDFAESMTWQICDVLNIFKILAGTFPQNSPRQCWLPYSINFSLLPEEILISSG